MNLFLITNLTFSREMVEHVFFKIEQSVNFLCLIFANFGNHFDFS